MAQTLHGTLPARVKLPLLYASILCLALPVPLQSFVDPRNILNIVFLLGALTRALLPLARPTSVTPFPTIRLPILPVASPSLIAHSLGLVFIPRTVALRRHFLDGSTLWIA